MNFSMSLAPADLSFGIESNRPAERHWGTCSFEIWQHPEHHPIRDRNFLKGMDLSVEINPLDPVGTLDGRIYYELKRHGIDKFIDRLPHTGPDYIMMTVYRSSDDRSNFVGINAMLSPEKYNFFKNCFDRFFPRSDVLFIMASLFTGLRLREFSEEMPWLPTIDEFREGKPYFDSADFSISVRARESHADDR